MEKTDAQKSEDAEESELVSQHAKELGEQFDAVVIICTRHEGSRGTRTVSKGAGNWHAQLGLVREWLLNTEQSIKQAIKREAKKDGL